MQYFKEVTDYFNKHKLSYPVGSSKDEIINLQKSLDCELPKAYREYLELMGKDYKGVMVGTDCFLSDVESNNQYLPEFLKENNQVNYKLPKKHLAFFCHQGYMMAWFSLPNENHDPQCDYYFEGSSETPKEYGSFSEFMKKDILGNAKLTVENQLHEKLRKKWWQIWK